MRFEAGQINSASRLGRGNVHRVRGRVERRLRDRGQTRDLVGAQRVLHRVRPLTGIPRREYELAGIRGLLSYSRQSPYR